MQDIQSSIDITIQDEAAAFALVCADSQRLFGDAATFGAGLACVSRVHKLYGFTSIFSFVFQAVNELAPRCIVYGLCQHSTGQAFYIQALQNDTVILVDDALAGGVDELIALTSHGAVNSLDALLCRFPAVTSFSPAGQRTIGFAEFALVVFGELRQAQQLAFVGGDEAIQPEVDSHQVLGNDRSNIVNFKLKAGEPLALPTADGGGFDLRAFWQVSMPANFDTSGDANNTKTVSFKSKAVPIGELRSVPSSGGFKPREARSLTALNPREERFVGFVQSPQDLLFCSVAKLPELLIKSPDFFQGSSLLVVSNCIASLSVGVDAMLKRRIVQTTEAPQHFFQLLLLSGGGVYPVFVATDHLLAFLVLNIFSYRRLRHRANSAYEITPTPQRGQSALQVRKLFSQSPGCGAFKPVSYLSNTERRIAFHKNVDMIRHYLQRMYLHAVAICYSMKQFLQPLIYWWHKNTAPVFRTPDNVIFETEYCPGILCVSAHFDNYTYDRYINQHELAGGAAIPLSAKADSPLAA